MSMSATSLTKGTPNRRALRRIAVKMLMGDRAKYLGLLFGIAFTSFLVTFAASYFAGFMTRSFSLIMENPEADVWVMDPAVQSVEQTTNIPEDALNRVKSVAGVRYALPLALGTVEARFPNGRFQTFQVIGVDDAVLAGAPRVGQDRLTSLRMPDAAIADAGGAVNKLQTPALGRDQWPHGAPHLDAPTRLLRAGDELLINEDRVRIIGVSTALRRYPPRPLLYMTFSNAQRVLPPERHRLTFVLAKAGDGVDPRALADRIAAQTGLRARASSDFISDTVYWFLGNSEDVGDIAAMLSLAMSVGFGVTGVLLYMFTTEHLRQYAVLKAMGATPRLLLELIFSQVALCAAVGSGLGLGACAIIGQFVAETVEYPFRMMWFTPLFAMLAVTGISVVAAVGSAGPLFRLEPGIVFASR